MKNDSLLYKLWQIVYPLAVYFLLDLLVVWTAEYLMSPRTMDGQMVFENYSAAVGSIIFLVISIAVCYLIYRKDYNLRSDWILRKPLYFPLLLLFGALASHGLSALVSLLQIDQLTRSYTEIESAVFAAPAVLVIIQTVLLAPVSEELLFRGILYKRIRQYTGGFWIPALISSAVFGLYHLNLAQGIFAFLFGLAACAVYDCIQNLWASVALHLGANLLSVILVYTGFDYPSQGALAGGMAAALAAAGLLFFFCIRPLRKITKNELG